jgi:putative glycosyltransferase (TIGR04372 family)
MGDMIKNIRLLDISNLRFIFFFERASKGKWIYEIFKFLLFFSIFGIPVLLLQRILSPFILFRFTVFPTNYLGHMIYEYESYKSRFNKTGKRTIDLFCVQPHVANRFLLSKISDFVAIVPREFILPVYLFNRAINARRFITPISQSYKLENAAELFLKKPGLDFSEAEIIRGDKLLKQIGWDGRRKVVSCFLRTDNYRKCSNSFIDVGSTNFRDVDTDTYGPALSLLAKRYFVRVVDLLPTSFPEANLTKDDIEFLNFYIVYRSDFSITTDSGSSLIPFILKVPNIQTNVSITSILYGVPGTLILPLTYFDLDSGRRVPFTELIRKSIFDMTEASQLVNAKIGVAQASAAELFALCQEIENGIPDLLYSNHDSAKNMKTLVAQFTGLFPNLVFSKFADSWIERHEWFVS